MKKAKKAKKSSSLTSHIPIVIIGSGFSGLGMAIRLKQEGIHDFEIFERADDLGGVWRDNSYPGCACDVESFLYSFSFAPSHNWSRLFPNQTEIWDYLRKCAKEYGLDSHIQFGREVQDAHWNESDQLWHIQTSQGNFTAKIVISGMGALNDPAQPKFAGQENFQGKIFHSANWDHEFDLNQKTVAVIGTGASAIQFVPQVQQKAKRLFLFQRTAPWVLPRMDRFLTKTEHQIAERFPSILKLTRWRIYLFRELIGLSFWHPKLTAITRRLALEYLQRKIPDPELRAKLTPSYTIGCKRILISDDYYSSLVRENVDVITDPIQEIKPHSILTQDGQERQIDAIIFGTGFRVTEMRCFSNVRGRNDATLSEAWQGSPQAFLGATVSGFPNFFILLGPNTGLGHSSVVLMIEAQIEHILKAIQYMQKKKIASLEPKSEVQRDYNREVDQKMKSTVWLQGGCKSWYLDHTGRNSTLWPSSVTSFRMHALKFNPAHYVATSSRR